MMKHESNFQCEFVVFTAATTSITVFRGRRRATTSLNSQRPILGVRNI